MLVVARIFAVITPAQAGACIARVKSETVTALCCETAVAASLLAIVSVFAIIVILAVRSDDPSFHVSVLFYEQLGFLFGRRFEDALPILPYSPYLPWVNKAQLRATSEHSHEVG